MLRHLIGGGPERRTVLTECSLMEALPGSLMTDVADMNCAACRRSLISRGVCPNCGGKKLAWDTAPAVRPGISPGRYNASDVTTEFYLGCGECSETLISAVPADVVAMALTRAGWRP